MCLDFGVDLILHVEVLNGGVHSVVDIIGYVKVLNGGRCRVVEDGTIRIITFCTDISFSPSSFFSCGVSSCS